MSDYKLFMQALNLTLQLSAAGESVDRVSYYPGHGVLVVMFQDKMASVNVNWNITELDLMQLAVEIIRKETGGSENGK